MNQTNNQIYTFRHTTNEAGKVFYRLRIENNNSSANYSSIISIDRNANGSVKVFPTVIRNTQLQIVSEKAVMAIQLFDTNGQLIMNKQTGGQTGYFTIHLPAISKGMYFVLIQTATGNEKVKIIVE